MRETELLSLVHGTVWHAILERGLLALDRLALILAQQHHVILEGALEEVAIGEVESALE